MQLECKSSYSLYNEELSTFGEDHVYNQMDSAGFITLLDFQQRLML